MGLELIVYDINITPGSGVRKRGATGHMARVDSMTCGDHGSGWNSGRRPDLILKPIVIIEPQIKLRSWYVPGVHMVIYRGPRYSRRGIPRNVSRRGHPSVASIYFRFMASMIRAVHMSRFAASTNEYPGSDIDSGHASSPRDKDARFTACSGKITGLTPQPLHMVHMGSGAAVGGSGRAVLWEV